MRTLENKQKRYKNLELREHKAKLALATPGDSENNVGRYRR